MLAHLTETCDSEKPDLITDIETTPTTTGDLEMTGVIAQALSLYRRRYSTIGLLENSLYPEIPATLKTIPSAGCKIFVATSKPHIYAKRILENFNLLSLFNGVYGSEIDQEDALTKELGRR